MNEELCSLHTHTHPNTGRLCVDIKFAAILLQSSLWLMRRSRSGRGRPQLFEFLACAAGKIGGAFEARSSMFIYRHLRLLEKDNSAFGSFWCASVLIYR